MTIKSNSMRSVKVIRFSRLITLPASHENPANPGVIKKVIVESGDAPEGRLRMINWATLLAGRSFNPHYHEDMEEVFIVLKGKIHIRCGSLSETLGPGDAVMVPPKVEHEMINTGTTPAHYIVVGITKLRNGKTIVTSK